MIIGIDNGTTGTIAILDEGLVFFGKVPTKKEFSYTKKKQKVTRIDTKKLRELLDLPPSKVIIERPLVNPGMFKATVSGVRALEAVLIVAEEAGHTVSYIDSKEWQKAMLPAGSKGKQLKKASLEVGNKLYPQVQSYKHPDRDGLLIAEYSKYVKE